MAANSDDDSDLRHLAMGATGEENCPPIACLHELSLANILESFGTATLIEVASTTWLWRPLCIEIAEKRLSQLRNDECTLLAFPPCPDGLAGALSTLRWAEEVNGPLDRVRGALSRYPHQSETTPIQRLIWPLALGKRDVCGITDAHATNSLIYVLPALFHTSQKPTVPRAERNGPIVLILVPTREMALQVSQCYTELGHVPSVPTSKRKQRKALKKGPEMCVATPTQLFSLAESGEADLKWVQLLVLDQLDQAIDMGIQSQIETLVGHTPAGRQTLVLSSRWDDQVQAVARNCCARKNVTTIHAPKPAKAGRSKRMIVDIGHIN